MLAELVVAVPDRVLVGLPRRLSRQNGCRRSHRRSGLMLLRRIRSRV